MVTIEVNGVEATIEDGEWFCKNSLVKIALEQVRTEFRFLGVPSYDPDPDDTDAREAIKKLGGKLVKTNPPQKIEDGRIY